MAHRTNAARPTLSRRSGQLQAAHRPRTAPRPSQVRPGRGAGDAPDLPIGVDLQSQRKNQAQGSRYCCERTCRRRRLAPLAVSTSRAWAQIHPAAPPSRGSSTPSNRYKPSTVAARHSITAWATQACAPPLVAAPETTVGILMPDPRGPAPSSARRGRGRSCGGLPPRRARTRPPGRSAAPSPARRWSTT